MSKIVSIKGEGHPTKPVKKTKVVSMNSKPKSVTKKVTELITKAVKSVDKQRKRLRRRQKSILVNVPKSISRKMRRMNGIKD